MDLAKARAKFLLGEELTVSEYFSDNSSLDEKFKQQIYFSEIIAKDLESIITKAIATIIENIFSKN